ncbi:MAG: hypothetical protein K2G89_03245 [Lachnospiraceae bacterium]|nr:hypothetical protein [Lachnospiraceae bacterium]
MEWVKDIILKYWRKSEKLRKIILEKPNLSVLSFSILGGFLIGCANALFALVEGESFYFSFNDFCVLWFILSAFIVYPAMFTVVNMSTLLLLPKSEKLQKKITIMEFTALFLGIFYSVLYGSVLDIQWATDWDVSIYPFQTHSPVWSEAGLTVIVLALVGLLGYVVLAVFPLKKMPPLAIALSIAAMYIGVGLGIVWSIQMMNQVGKTFPLVVLPFNFAVMTAKRIRYILAEREETGELHRLPLLGLLLMLPLLGILICILILFGQRPDAIIKAWTDTADWTLSTKTPPPPLEYDGHYLCTVAAGGHKKVVKPLRMGERHGHRIVVNRQLLVANAFEQLLEERMPNVHRNIRHFYDTYGLPVAKLIKTKLAADVVYIIMKPLEWIFLIVLYLFDTNPENRIALQYLPPRVVRQLRNLDER